MIAAIDPELRALLSDETLGAIARTLERGVTCMICAAWMGPEDDGRASAVALRRKTDGDTLIRFAHETYSPSRLIEVEELPEGEEPQRAAASAELEWALSVRTGVLPMVVLVAVRPSSAHPGISAKARRRVTPLEPVLLSRG